MTVTYSSPQRGQSPRIELKIGLARSRRIGELSAKCPICGKPIQDSLEMHEVLLTKGDVQGASDAVQDRINCAENCVLVHPECHYVAQHTLEGKKSCIRLLIIFNGYTALFNCLKYMREICVG